MSSHITARKMGTLPSDLLIKRFSIEINSECDAVFADSSCKSVIGVCGLPFRAPVTLELLKDRGLVALADEICKGETSLLLVWNERTHALLAWKDQPVLTPVSIETGLATRLIAALAGVRNWPGTINAKGEHEIDLRSPAPGPHFFVNMLLGNRIGFDSPLQTTPKSVLDRFGRGSFRSHAATQVLATRWDFRQEENGFPCNRQFYVLENGVQIFHSGSADGDRIVSARCVHSQNNTVITYKTSCGLEIVRTFFLLPQEKGLPLACEVQRIDIHNHSDKKRSLKLVYTGMFGSAKPAALMEDVLYSTIIMQAGALNNDDGSILALSPDYHPIHDRNDLRFNSLVLETASGPVFPREFCTDYQEFVGSGSLDQPAGIARLSNRLSRKGPGFFACALPLEIAANTSAKLTNFTGLVSNKTNPDFSPASLKIEVEALLARFGTTSAVDAALSKVQSFYEDYRGFLELSTSDADFDRYCNRNLPFQVLYQTFVSRSFCQTQKGYREIGFREIQDIFAAMYYFNARGLGTFARDLIAQWAAQVFEFGYAWHNFFWTGKEAGKWSDDALWLVQAVSRYVSLTGDHAFLDMQIAVAGSEDKKRSLYDTLIAIIRYSGEISVGRHGIPLLDNADWNDCLTLDRDYLNGPAKEKRYYTQLETEKGKMGDPLNSDYSESVMNAFLLKLAADELAGMAQQRGDAKTTEWANTVATRMNTACQDHAWKDNWFARLLFNRYPGYKYAGAGKDGLATDGQDGTLFLNSFSWAVLSKSASEKQIASMFNQLEKRLKTDYGYRLVTPMDLARVVSGAATSEYFPGDRENGAVFKHASMMAVSAMLEAAKTVKDTELAKKMAASAWWMLGIALPVRTMTNPFAIAGNPRFCTQYNNSETGENIGPLLSGTSTWYTLALMKAFGIDCQGDKIILDPILKESEQDVSVRLNTGAARYVITMRKPAEFRRALDASFTLTLDGKQIDGNTIPLFRDNKEHQVTLQFK